MFKLETYCSDEIHRTIGQALSEAKNKNDQCQFEFNGVTVLVAPDSSADLIYRDWYRGLSGYLGKSPTVGPYPSELTEAEIASDKAIQSEIDRKESERQQAYEKERLSHSERLQATLKDASSLELKDEPKWNEFVEKNRDPYGAACVQFAEKWGRLMQLQIAQGKTVAECAQETSRLADDDGITGFMYGAAVAMLSKCWKYGEELRVWHNLKTQIGTEGQRANESGGVLNPAVMTIG